MKPIKEQFKDALSRGRINENDSFTALGVGLDANGGIPKKAEAIAKEILDIFMEAQNESGEIDHEAVEEEIHQLLLKRR